MRAPNAQTAERPARTAFSGADGPRGAILRACTVFAASEHERVPLGRRRRRGVLAVGQLSFGLRGR